MSNCYNLPSELETLIASGLEKCYVVYGATQNANRTTIRVVGIMSDVWRAMKLVGKKRRMGVLKCVLGKAGSMVMNSITAKSEVPTQSIREHSLMFHLLPRELSMQLYSYLKMYYLVSVKLEARAVAVEYGVYRNLGTALIECLKIYSTNGPGSQLNRYDEKANTWTLSKHFDHTRRHDEYTIDTFAINDCSGTHRPLNFDQEFGDRYPAWPAFCRAVETAHEVLRQEAARRQADNDSSSSPSDDNDGSSSPSDGSDGSSSPSDDHSDDGSADHFDDEDTHVVWHGSPKLQTNW